jgi:hypothetical protein
MKRKAIIFKLAGFLLAAAFSLTGCGDELISEIKDFEPNEAPVITSFLSDVAPGSEIYPSMQINLTVSAADSENDPLTYSFSSEHGTFIKETPTETGCTIMFFILSSCPGSQSIPVTVTVSDDKNGSASSTLDLGDGRTQPALSGLSWTGSNVTFTADCSGWCQTIVTDTSTESVVFDGQNVTEYTAGSSSTIMHSGTSGKRVFLVFRDRFLRQALAYEDF